MNRKNNNGVSLVETMVASIIFLIAVAGVMMAMGSIRKPVSENDLSIGAATYGRKVLEDLRSRVDAGDASGDLDVGRTHTKTMTVDGVAYTATYEVFLQTGNVKRVDLNVSWDGP